jgi:hypothetical protein
MRAGLSRSSCSTGTGRSGRARNSQRSLRGSARPLTGALAIRCVPGSWQGRHWRQWGWLMAGAVSAPLPAPLLAPGGNGTGCWLGRRQRPCRGTCWRQWRRLLAGPAPAPLPAPLLAARAAPAPLPVPLQALAAGRGGARTSARPCPRLRQPALTGRQGPEKT